MKREILVQRRCNWHIFVQRTISLITASSFMPCCLREIRKSNKLQAPRSAAASPQQQALSLSPHSCLPPHALHTQSGYGYQSSERSAAIKTEILMQRQENMWRRLDPYIEPPALHLHGANHNRKVPDCPQKRAPQTSAAQAPCRSAPVGIWSGPHQLQPDLLLGANPMLVYGALGIKEPGSICGARQ